MTLRRYGLLLLAALLVHTLLAVSLPVSGDEAYYWDCSRHLDWSYFDQPPLVIWTMVPFRAVFGESRLAVRAPALLASLLLGIFLLGLVRRLGGGPREAAWAYLVLHAMPLFFIGAFYTSTDIAMATAFVAAAWAAAALAQGERRAWWGFGLAVGLGFLAKFPVVLVLPALVPALVRRETRRDLATPVPWLAGLVALLLTAPVWIWGARHGWDNITFQLAGRHHEGALTFKYVGEFLGANLLLATPTLFVAAAAAVWLALRSREPARVAVALAALGPFAVFGAVALRERVGAHWGGPGLVAAVVLAAVTRLSWRRTAVVAGAVFGLLLSFAVVVVALVPERLAAVEWSYRGRPHRISTKKLAAAVGNREIARRVAARRDGRLVASESYSTVHLLAFLSGGEIPTRLAHVKPGKHGLASLYWYPPESLRGRDMLVVTEKPEIREALSGLFARVDQEPPVVIRRGPVTRTLTVYACTDLLHPEGAFTRLSPAVSP